VAALVCLLVVLLVGAAILRSLTIQRQFSRTAAQCMQSFWIAESAASRAAARLREDPSYSGETWRVRLVQGRPPAAAVRGSAVVRGSPDPARPSTAGLPGEPTSELPQLAAQNAIAVIRVEARPGQPDQRFVRIDARWPDDPLSGTAYHKELVIQLPVAENKP
jgi:hypothetical protein